MRGLGKARGILYQFQSRQAALYRAVWQRWQNPAGYSIPVFLVGSGRSGTSMIVHHLNRLWQVELFNEDHPAAFRDWHLRDLSLVEALVRRSHARVVLFKPVKDTYRSHIILSHFPTARALFTFRHYDDVVNSARKKFYDETGLLKVIKPREAQKSVIANRLPSPVKWMNTDFAEFSAAPPPEETKRFIKSLWEDSLNLESIIALDWLFYNRLFFDLNLVCDQRIRLVQYENLVTNPVQELDTICCFLDVEFKREITEGIFASSIGRASPPAIDPKIRAACEALWQRLLGTTADRRPQPETAAVSGQSFENSEPAVSPEHA